MILPEMTETVYADRGIVLRANDWDIVWPGLPTTFDIPDDAYVEGYRFKGAYPVYVMWEPGGRIMVKPGCLRLEHIERTIERLRTLYAACEQKANQGRRPTAFCQTTLGAPRIKRWLDLLVECKKYEWSAE